jgi:hypothetical protein
MENPVRIKDSKVIADILNLGYVEIIIDVIKTLPFNSCVMNKELRASSLREP